MWGWGRKLAKGFSFSSTIFSLSSPSCPSLCRSDWCWTYHSPALADHVRIITGVCDHQVFPQRHSVAPLPPSKGEYGVGRRMRPHPWTAAPLPSCPCLTLPVSVLTGWRKALIFFLGSSTGLEEDGLHNDTFPWGLPRLVLQSRNPVISAYCCFWE